MSKEVILHGFGGGGASSALNFKVVGNPKPTDPTENTIWVETDFEITGYAFSVTQPTEPVEGMVWITVGTSSPVAFNALKKNNITVYPLSAKQYVGGSWVNKTAQSYQNDEWVRWITDLYLYDNGTVTEAAGSVASDNGKNAFSLNATTLHINSTGHNVWGHIYFTKKIDLTYFKTLYMVGKMAITGAGESWGSIQFGVFPSLTATAAAKIEGAKAQGTHSIDVSELSGEYYVSFYLKGFANYATADVNEVWLE